MWINQLSALEGGVQVISERWLRNPIQEGEF
jgi:hypothetical protein